MKVNNNKMLRRFKLLMYICAALCFAVLLWMFFSYYVWDSVSIKYLYYMIVFGAPTFISIFDSIYYKNFSLIKWYLKRKLKLKKDWTDGFSWDGEYRNRDISFTLTTSMEIRDVIFKKNLVIALRYDMGMTRKRKLDLESLNSKFVNDNVLWRASQRYILMEIYFFMPYVKTSDIDRILEETANWLDWNYGM